MRKAATVSVLVALWVPGLALLSACPTTTPSPAGASPTPTTAATASDAPTAAPTTAPATVALGGRLYDDWIHTTQASPPPGNSPLWATQTTNTRTGKDTWRCKECHGWDYKGKDGAYGSGSHKTGFTGVYSASSAKTADELAAILKGTSNASHSFSAYLSTDQIAALAAFIKVGATVDETQYIDYTTKKPKSGDAAKGKANYDSVCAACHGADGKTINFGSASDPEYVGTVASENPWEFIHKVRFGQPGEAMPAGVEKAWSVQDVVDILTHAQSLAAN